MERKRVLIVEDNTDIRELVSLLLRQEGFETFTAADCGSGYEQLLRHNPDAVITDLMLPDFSGLDFIRWVRNEDRFVELPIIAITAFENGYLTAAQHLGADRVLHKPEGLDELVEAVKAMLTNQSQPQEYVRPDEHEPPQGEYVN